MTTQDSTAQPQVDLAEKIYRWLLWATRIVMAGAFVFALIEQQWLTAGLVVGIYAMISLPGILERRFTIHIPAEFELITLIFVFAAMFLGEVRGYYERFWWWDIVLHTTSGLLLGILGFLLIYVLNENDRVDLHLRPRFVALFAFLFAVAMGAIWEIFEFTMDQLFGLNMQKPMLGDPSGKTDTMWDLIVDTVGALVISVGGWWYLANHRASLVGSWIRKFIERNPRLFRHKT